MLQPSHFPSLITILVHVSNIRRRHPWKFLCPGQDTTSLTCRDTNQCLTLSRASYLSFLICPEPQHPLGSGCFFSGCCCLQEGSEPALPECWGLRGWGRAGAEASSLSKPTREVPKGFVKGCFPLESHREMENTEGIRLRARAKHLQDMGAWIYLISHDARWKMSWISARAVRTENFPLLCGILSATRGCNKLRISIAL